MYDPAPQPSSISVPRPVLPLDRLAALVEVVICSGFPSQIVLIVILRGFGLHMMSPDGRLSPPFVFTVSLLDAILVVTLVVFFLLVHHESPRQVLFGRRPLAREEVQRGFIAHRFGQYLGGGALGVVIYSFFFGLGHIEQGYDAMIATGILGLIWGFVYLARRSIVAPMVSHAGFNVAQLLKYLAFATR